MPKLHRETAMESVVNIYTQAHHRWFWSLPPVGSLLSPIRSLQVDQERVYLETVRDTQGTFLFRRQAPPDAEFARVLSYAVLQHDGDDSGCVAKGDKSRNTAPPSETDPAQNTEKEAPQIPLQTVPEAEKQLGPAGAQDQQSYRILLAQAREQHHAELR